MTTAMITAAENHSSTVSDSTRRLRTFRFPGPAGSLEAVVNEGSSQARCAALVCHPHPLGGGNLHNKVVYHAMKVLNAPAWGFSWPVLRFNFRGTGLSDGAHHGALEHEDVLAALAWLENEYNRPVVAVGFSFGAVMCLRACCHSGPATPRVRAVAALGLPISAEGREYRYDFLSQCYLPKLFLSGDRDSFAPAPALAQAVAQAAEPRQMVVVPGADHFFTGRLDPMQHALAAWLKEQVP